MTGVFLKLLKIELNQHFKQEGSQKGRQFVSEEGEEEENKSFEELKQKLAGPQNLDETEIESENLEIEKSVELASGNLSEKLKSDFTETFDDNLFEYSDEALSDNSNSGCNLPKIDYRNLFEPLDEDLLQPPTETYFDRPPLFHLLESDDDEESDEDDSPHTIPNEFSSNNSSTYHSIKDSESPTSKISTSEAKTNKDESSNNRPINENEIPSSKLPTSEAETIEDAKEDDGSKSAEEISPKNVLNLFPFER